MQENGLVISFPALELNSVPNLGSIFQPELLFAAPISDTVRSTLSLFTRISTAARVRMFCVARPEMFTHGISHDWLLSKLGPIRDHVCVSDGTTIRIIPGMRNHVFFHGQNRRADVVALARLEHRVPELFGVPLSQVNSAYRFRIGARLVTPDPLVIPALEENVSDESNFYRFCPPSFTIDAALSIIEKDSGLALPDWRVETLTYIPLTETSLDDPTFMTYVAQIIVRTYFDNARGVVIQLPTADNASHLAGRVQAVLEALDRSDVLIPAIPAARVVFSDADVTTASLQEVACETDIFVHDTFDFWRHTATFYSAFRNFRMIARRGRYNPALLAPLFVELCGRTPTIEWSTRFGDRDQF